MIFIYMAKTSNIVRIMVNFTHIRHYDESHLDNLVNHCMGYDITLFDKYEVIDKMQVMSYHRCARLMKAGIE